MPHAPARLQLKISRAQKSRQLLGASTALVAALRALWSAHETAPGEIEVSFVEEVAMKQLHYDYLQDASTTDIITFDLGVSPAGVRLGALYICPAVAKRYAARYRVPVRKELQRLIAHGVLHLLGFDDHSPQDKRRMRRAENKILARL